MLRINVVITVLLALAIAFVSVGLMLFHASAGSGGVLDIYSQSVYDGSYVSSTWDLIAVDESGNPLPDLCLSNPCSGTIIFYNAPFGTYQLVAVTAPTGYASTPEYLAIRRDPLRWITSPTTTISISSPSSTSIGVFDMLWNPLPTFDLSTTTIDLNDSHQAENFTITNDGPNGSGLNWTSTIAYVSGPASNWLILSQSASGANPLVATPPPATQTITASVDPSGLVAGTPYVATINFVGDDYFENQIIPPPPPITVTYTKLGMTCPGDAACPVCPTFFAQPATVIPPGASVLTYSCQKVDSCSISGGQFGAGQPVAVQGGKANGTANVAPSSNTVYTISCTGGTPQDPQFTSETTQVNVQGPGIQEVVPL